MSIKLQVNGDWRVTSDKFQWRVERKRARSDQVEWQPIAYFLQPGLAFSYLAARMIRVSEADNFIDAVKNAKAIAAQINTLLHPPIDVSKEDILGNQNFGAQKAPKPDPTQSDDSGTHA